MSLRASRASFNDPSSRLDPSSTLRSTSQNRGRSTSRPNNRSSSMNRTLSMREASQGRAHNDHSLSSNPGVPQSPIAQSFAMARDGEDGPLQDELDVRPTSSATNVSTRYRSTSSASAVSGPSRSNTLKKQKSLSRKSGSLSRRSSKRSVRAGAIGGVTYDDTSGVDVKNVFYTPVPTSGTPVQVLADRFQAWRKVLKDLMTYAKEVQTSYEARAKSGTKLSNTINNIAGPASFMAEGGINDAIKILQQHHKQAIAESAKAKQIETDVISQLATLKHELTIKIKEIKHLSGDFKNSVEKEKESTKKILGTLQESLGAVDQEQKAMVGKDDPFIVRMAVDRQVERQIDEENYLHRAYLNIEGSGRELESIVVGEVQKAYNALATILKKEADENYDTVDKLRNGPISMPQDLEWQDFIEKDPHFITPDTQLRVASDLEYPGKFHPAAAEVRSGMLERKSKYLKSYTAGWFVLSPTHLHEFKSAEGVHFQAPIVSLYLPDQQLGKHSQPDANSHKFILKGRQTGTMHRGHSWVFRAESYDTMLAWYDDLQQLINKSGEERNDFVRRHTRTHSSASGRSISSFETDAADDVPYAANGLLMQGNSGGGAASYTTGDDRDHVDGVDARDMEKRDADVAPQQQRPAPGGRFPSDIQPGRRDLHRVDSASSDEEVLDLGTAAGEVYGGIDSQQQQQQQQPQRSYQPEHGREAEYATLAAAVAGAPAAVGLHRQISQPSTTSDTEHQPQPVASRSAPLDNNTTYTSPGPDEYSAHRAPGQLRPAPTTSTVPEPQSAELLVTTPLPPLSGFADQQLETQTPTTGHLGGASGGIVTRNEEHPNVLLGGGILGNKSAEQGYFTSREPSPALRDVNPQAARAVGTALGSDADYEGFVSGAEGSGSGAERKALARQGTDFSVRDLHVPGEYPRAV